MPQATLKSSVLLAHAQSLVLQAPCQCHVPLAQQIVHCTVSHLSCCQPGQFSPPVFRWPDFLGRNSIVPSLSEMSDFLRNWFWSSFPRLASPSGVWAEPSSRWFQLCYLCFAMEVCTAKVGLLATAEKSCLLHLSHQKKTIFV